MNLQKKRDTFVHIFTKHFVCSSLHRPLTDNFTAIRVFSQSVQVFFRFHIAICSLAYDNCRQWQRWWLIDARVRLGTTATASYRHRVLLAPGTPHTVESCGRTTPNIRAPPAVIQKCLTSYNNTCRFTYLFTVHLTQKKPVQVESGDTRV